MEHGRRRWVLASLLVAAALAGTPERAEAQWAVESKDGVSSIRFGFLVQGWAETLDSSSGDDPTRDLYFRRLRLMAGGSITDRLGFFLDTDSPNLGKTNPDGSKQRPGVAIQDFVVSFELATGIFLDGGMILNPSCYNCNQSAASLLPVDYGAFSFVTSAPLTADVGRDYGLQARGYLLDDHLELRAGVFQGRRGEDGSNDFRTTLRVMWNVFEAQRGLFYTGTSLGTRKLLSFGGSYDSQDDYRSFALDAFLDLPLFASDGLTLQADWMSTDGGDFLTGLPGSDAWLFEAGYYAARFKLAPFLQLHARDFDDPAAADQLVWQAGLACYPMGQRLALKLGLGQLETEGAPDRFHGMLQVQIFTF